MTVKEIVEYLSRYPEKTEVEFFHNGDGVFLEIKEINERYLNLDEKYSGIEINLS